MSEGGYLLPETTRIYHERTDTLAAFNMFAYRRWELLVAILEELLSVAKRQSNKYWENAHDIEEVDTLEYLWNIVKEPK